MNTTDVQVFNLSDDDKLLYEADLIELDDTNMPTTAGWEILKGIIWAENKSKVVELVKKINASKEGEK